MMINKLFFNRNSLRLSLLSALCVLTLCGVDAQVVKRITAVTHGEDATSIPFSGPVYEFLYEYDSQGRITKSKFRSDEFASDSLYVKIYKYGDKQIEITGYDEMFQGFFHLPLDKYLQKLDNGLVKEENLSPEDSEWAVYDKHEPYRYEYNSERQLITYKDWYQELHFTRGQDGNIAEVAPYQRNGVPSNMTIGYDDILVNEASLRLGSLILLLGAQDFGYSVNNIRNGFSDPTFKRLGFIWGGFLGKPDTKIVSQMKEVSNYILYNVATSHHKTLEFDYTIDNRGLITAVDAVTTDDYYYEKPVQQLNGRTEAHQFRTTHFEIEWDETTGIRQPEAVGSNHAEAEYFSLSGERLPAPRKGLNIVRTKDGQARKVVIK